jgi:hypothetical protein
MEEIWKRTERIEKEGWGIGKNVNFWNRYLYVCNQESQSPEDK